MSNQEPTIACDYSTEAGVGFVAGKLVGLPRTHPGSHPYAIVPKDCELRTLPDEKLTPTRVIGTATLFDHNSLIAYVKRFSEGDAVLFADVTRRQITAVLDYHTSKDPSYASHRALFSAVFTPEWETWTKNAGKRMSQVEFAEFLDNNAAAVRRPSAADLYELALNMQGTKTAQFAGKVKPENGSFVFSYSEEVQGKTAGTVEIPREIDLHLAVFRGTDEIDVRAKFRFRVEDGKLVLWYDLPQVEKLVRDMFDEVVLDVGGRLDSSLLHGAPMPPQG